MDQSCAHRVDMLLRREGASKGTGTLTRPLVHAALVETGQSVQASTTKQALVVVAAAAAEEVEVVAGAGAAATYAQPATVMLARGLLVGRTPPNHQQQHLSSSGSRASDRRATIAASSNTGTAGSQVSPHLLMTAAVVGATMQVGSVRDRAQTLAQGMLLGEQRLCHLMAAAATALPSPPSLAMSDHLLHMEDRSRKTTQAWERAVVLAQLKAVTVLGWQVSVLEQDPI